VRAKNVAWGSPAMPGDRTTRRTAAAHGLDGRPGLG